MKEICERNIEETIKSIQECKTTRELRIKDLQNEIKMLNFREKMMFIDLKKAYFESKYREDM